MIAVLVILALMSVPLSLIATRTYLKAKQLSQGGADGARVKLLEAELKELRGRVEVLETIAIDSRDDDAMAVEPLAELEELRLASLRR